jgi:long-chain acyl-CoA synthetase
MSERANLAALVRGPAALTPDRTALIDGARRLTWAELDGAIDHAAGGLRELGLHPGDRVALLLGNSIEFVVGYFAILRAGLVAVPMNPAYTVAEVAVLLTDSGARLLLVDPTTRAVGTEVVEAIASCEIVDVSSDAWRSLLAAPPFAPGDEAVAPNGLALLLFTAGTSGRPKGAMLSHAALLANIDMLRSVKEPPAVLESDTVLLVLPLFHVYGLNTALGLAVSAGATCVIIDRFDPVESLRLIVDEGVTTVAGAPAMYQAWCRVPSAREAFRDVRLLSSGGSPLPVSVFEAFRELTGTPVFEGYGMTETAPVVSTTLVSGVAKAGSVGRPLPGVEVRLVDDSGQDVDDGDAGEVWVRGASVFTGYWPAGLGGPDAEGWFRSGDVAYADAEGDLHLVDRRREVILVNGFNVYPREIELAIEGLAGVVEVAVVGVPDDATGEAVSAIVVTAEGAGPTREEIAAHCATRLARFKCPSSIRIVDALPHSATGKIAKGRLREVYGEQ